MTKKKNDPFAWNNAIRKMNELSKSEPKITNTWDYLRGKNGVVVHVFPTNYLKFSVEVKGKMGWSEGLFESEEGGRWDGSGTYMTFNTFDEALDAGIGRVDYLIEIMNKSNTENNEKS